MPRSEKPTGPSAPNRRMEILENAAAVFARKGVASATVRDIADESHILSGSLYHHFDSKDQMVEEILRTGFEELINGYSEAIARGTTAAESIRGVLGFGIAFMMQHPVVGLIIRNDSRQLEQIDRFAFISDYKRELQRIVTAELGRGVAVGELRSDLDMQISYYLISDALLGSSRYVALGGRTHEEVSARISDLVIRALSR
jgi:AcrR family transcriptional regulator